MYSLVKVRIRISSIFSDNIETTVVLRSSDKLLISGYLAVALCTNTNGVFVMKFGLIIIS